MKKRIAFLLFIIVITQFISCTHSRVFRNEQILVQDYVKISLKLNSSWEDPYVLPSYEIIIEKADNCKIRRLSFDVFYSIPTAKSFVYERKYNLHEDSLELQELNENGRVVVSVELEPVLMDPVHGRINLDKDQQLAIVPLYLYVK